MSNIKIIILLIICFLLTGCWDRKEISKNTIVTGIAIDTGEKQKYKITIEGTNAVELNPRTAQGIAPATVLTLEGNSIGELAHKMNILAAQRLIYSHMRLLIISEEVAHKNLLTFLDFFDRDREIRDDFNIIIAKNSKAEKILKVTNEYKKLSSLKIFPQLNEMLDEWGGVPGIRLNDFIRTYTSDGQVPMLAAMIVVGNPEKGNSTTNMKEVIPSAIVKIDSAAFFKKGELIDFLTLNEVRNLLWIENKILHTSLTIPCNEKGKYMDLRILGSETSVKAKEVKGIPTFHVKIKAEASLEGTDCKVNLSEVSTMNKYNELTNKKMEKDIGKLVEKMQEEYKADIFGFGEILREQDYKHFKKYKNDWSEGFKKSKVYIDVNVKIKRSGIRVNKYDVK
ncbi:MAG: Ger(x)C family spore germination protein [Bacillus sp. (in: firmicutes)]